MTSLSLPERSDVNFHGVSAACLHSAFWHFYWRAEGRGNERKDKRRRMRGHENCWNIQHIYSLTGAFLHNSDRTKFTPFEWRKSKNSMKWEFAIPQTLEANSCLRHSFFFVLTHRCAHLEVTGKTRLNLQCVHRKMRMGGKILRF